MDRRRRQRGELGESADERLDRLIAMESRAKSMPPTGRDATELRRLKVVPEGEVARGAREESREVPALTEGAAEGMVIELFKPVQDKLSVQDKFEVTIKEDPNPWMLMGQAQGPGM